MAKQDLKTVLIPEKGLSLQPAGVVASSVETDFLRSISHLVVQGPTGPVMVQGTTGGDIRVVTVTIAYEVYDVNAGSAPDVYDAPNSFLYADAQYVTDLLIETFGATVSFRDSTGVWGGNKSLQVGFYSFDFLHYGVRIQNRVALSVCDYEITCYR